jgi:hypothetical protein
VALGTSLRGACIKTGVLRTRHASIISLSFPVAGIITSLKVTSPSCCLERGNGLRKQEKVGISRILPRDRVLENSEKTRGVR